MWRQIGYDVKPATDEDVRAVIEACREYLEDLDRGGVGPDNRNLYQEDRLHLMGVRMPALLARLEAAEGSSGISAVA
ncbi:MAG: hypothetical protein ACYC1C_01235 [Chloroflexota bacterium]